MGNSRVSIRTLPDGYKVRHFPPDEAHPEGRMVMLPGQSPLCDRLDATLQGDYERQQELAKVHTERIAAKRAAHEANGMPPEKSHV